MKQKTGGLLLLLIAAAPVHTIWSGFALAKLWAWFLMPLGLPEIGIAHAAGVMVIVAFLTHQYEPERGSEGAVERLFAHLAKPGVALLFGWIITLFM